MRWIRPLFCVIFLYCFAYTQAQQFFPVKLDKKWGLINNDGKLVLPPVYDAIGEFKHFGYAVMQKQGLVGLLGPNGQETLSARYDDLKVLGENLVAVMDNEEWRVINHQGKTVLDKGYERVKIIQKDILLYKKQGKWGLVKKNGQEIAPPVYSKIELLENHYFQTSKGGFYGLLNDKGNVILSNRANEIRLTENASLFFFREGRIWGAADPVTGHIIFEPLYDAFLPIGHEFFKLYISNKIHFYSIACNQLVEQHYFNDYYVFTKSLLVAKKDHKLGLIDWCGQVILSPQYDEIQYYTEQLFRVKKENLWGVVDMNNKAVIPLNYQYIAPLNGAVSIVKQGNKFGLINKFGEILTESTFDRIELENNTAKAYTINKDGSEALKVFNLSPSGQISQGGEFAQHFQIKIGKKAAAAENTTTQNDNEYNLDQFEWFYSTEKDQWGLRQTQTGKIQIEPIFDYIKVNKKLGYTLVGKKKSNDYEFERTSFRFEMIYGLVLNDLGILVTQVDFIDVRLHDFEEGNSVARVIFPNGKHGLIDSIGRIVRRDITYIGSFHDGLARVSFTGRLSGKRAPDYPVEKLQSYLRNILSPNYMVDYTQYDQLFQQQASLICEDCEWGYIDANAVVVVKPTYSFAYDIVNETGLVNCNDKWGMVGNKGQVLIPCQYDKIEFLENTDNQIVRIYREQPKFGLIDTLGQLTVNVVYEEIGDFSNGRLAVKRNNLWGFVDRNGHEVIPCRFKAIHDFSESYAAVLLGDKWGFIDKNGDTLIDFKYTKVGNFKEGLTWVLTKQGVAYINKNEQFIIPPRFNKAFDFEQGIARIVINKAFGLINTKGDFVLKPKYTNISPFDNNGLAVASMANDRSKLNLINLKGQQITNGNYKHIGPFRDGLAVVKNKHGYGYIDINGDIAINCGFKKAGDFHEGRAIIQQSNKCGFIDTEGIIVIPCAYTNCKNFIEGKAIVYKGIDKAGIIGKDGELIIEPSLDRLIGFQEGRGLMRDDNYRFYYITEQTTLYDGYYDRASTFSHGVAVVQIDKKWGVINQKGIEIIAPKYDYIEGFVNGYAKVKIEGYNGLSNLNGELIVQPNYEFISYAGGGIFRVEQGDKIGYFDHNGKWVWDLRK